MVYARGPDESFYCRTDLCNGILSIPAPTQGRRVHPSTHSGKACPSQHPLREGVSIPAHSQGQRVHPSSHSGKGCPSQHPLMVGVSIPVPTQGRRVQPCTHTGQAFPSPLSHRVGVSIHAPTKGRRVHPSTHTGQAIATLAAISSCLSIPVVHATSCPSQQSMQDRVYPSCACNINLLNCNRHQLYKLLLLQCS